MSDNTEIFIKPFGNMQIKIHTEDREYLSVMKEEFTRRVSGFQFMPKYKAGVWDGKVCMINKATNTMPYGLLFDIMRIHKKNFPQNKLIIDPEIKELFKGTAFRVKQDLKLKPYAYQKDCINASIKHKKGIIRSATSSGKCSKDIELEIKIDDDLYKKLFSDYENME